MFLDWINSLLEFVVFILVILSFNTDAVRSCSFLLYSLLSCIGALYFVISPIQLLPVNSLVFICVGYLSFPAAPSKHRILFAVCSVLYILLGQFILLAFLPSFLLQTNHGNLIVNMILICCTGLFFFLSKKRDLSRLLSAFIIEYWYILTFIFLVYLGIGQLYLNRLFAIWTYLPGVIALSTALILILFGMIYIHYQRSQDHLQAQLFLHHIEDSQNLINTMRVQLHDYKHHLRHLQNLIESASDLSDLRMESTTYISQLKEDRSLYELLLSLDDPVMRAFLFGCYNRCSMHKIPFQLESTPLLPSFPIKEYQLVEVIENLFSNALEHNLSLDPPKRFIKIVLTSDGTTHSFAIENPANNITLPLEALYQAGTTTKSGEHQGLGLSSIHQILSSYGIQFSGRRDYIKDSIVFSFTYSGGQNL